MSQESLFPSGATLPFFKCAWQWFMMGCLLVGKGKVTLSPPVFGVFNFVGRRRKYEASRAINGALRRFSLKVYPNASLQALPASATHW